VKLTKDFFLLRVAKKRKRNKEKVNPYTVCSETVGDNDIEKAKENFKNCVRNVEEEKKT